MSKPEVIATRRTFDGKTVQLWSDGALTQAFGFAIKGISRKIGLDTGWHVFGWIETIDSKDVPLLVKAASKGGLPGEVRKRFYEAKRREEMKKETFLGFKLSWSVIETDRSGKPIARVAVLPRMVYPGLAIWHERGKYEIMRQVTRAPMGYLPSRAERGKGSNSYEETGFAGSTLASVLAKLPLLKERVVSERHESGKNPRVSAPMKRRIDRVLGRNGKEN